MADPKIKYDIEAAVKGEADAEQLAKTLRDVGDVLEGDLQKSAQDAAQALEALGAKQRALNEFGALKLQTQSLSQEFEKAVSTVDRLGNELQDAGGKTQTLATAEKTATTATQQAQAELQRKKDALKAVRDETTGTARRTDDYRNTVAGLKDGIKAATAELKSQQAGQREAAQAATTAQNAEAALRKEYDLAIGSAAKLSSELRVKNGTLAAVRDQMQAVGLSTTNLTAQERNLQGAVQQVREAVAAMAPAYQQAAAASSQSTQVQAANQRTLREGMSSISAQLQRIQQIATLAIGGGYFGGLIKDVGATADEFKNLEARVKLATGEGPLFEKSFGGVQRVALATNSSLEETGNLFARLTKASQEGGMAAAAAQERALRLTTTINQATQLSGGAAESARAALTQLIQGLQSGVLRGEEFNSVMEQAPRLAEALAKGLNVTTGELREMAGQGALTAETVMKALEGQADVVAREYGKLPPTVGRALQNLSTQWTLYVGAADKGLISSTNAAKVIDALAGNLDILVNTLTMAGKVWGAMQIAKIAEWFAGWAAKTIAATQAVEANSVATTANTAAHRANAIAVNASAAAQAANAAASATSTAAQTANAKSWGELGNALKGVNATQGELQRQTAQSTAALDASVAAKGRFAAAAASANTSVGILGRGVGALTGLLGGPLGLGVALTFLAPEIQRLGVWLGETAAKAMGYGKSLEEAERQSRLSEEAAKQHAEALRRQAVALEEVRNRSFDLNKESTGLIGQFDKLRKEGDTAAEAIAKIGKDFDLGSAPGIRNASAVLDKLVADGKISASEFQGAWAKALDGQDLMKFEILARQAFATAGSEAKKLGKQIEDAIKSGASEEVVNGLRQRLQGALAAATREGERVAEMMDNVLRAAVQRTGLEFTALEGRIGAASRSALNDLDVVIGGLDRLKKQGIDVGRVLETSLVKAINTADSQKAIDEVRVRVEELRKTLGDRVADGLLDQAKAKALELSDALDKAKPGINSLREAMKALGVTSDEALKQVATSSRSAFDFMVSSGKASARELSEGFKKAAEDAIAANKGIAPEWVKSTASVRGFKIEVDDAGRATLKSVGDIGRSAKAAGDQFKDLGRTAADVLRSMGIEADKVSTKVQQLVKQGQMLSAAFQQRQDNRNQEIEDSKYMNRGTTAGQDLVPTFNSREEAEAWKQAWLEQYERDNPFRTTAGQLGNYMRDLTLFEFDRELDALKIREAMEAAKKKAEGGAGGGGTGGGGEGGGPGSGGGGGRIDRIVNIYIGNSMAYPVPTNLTGQQSIEALAREVLRVIEQQKIQLGV